MLRERAKESIQLEANQSEVASKPGRGSREAYGKEADAGQVAELNKRIESLESKVDLLIRQMSALAKQLEEKE